MSDFGTHQAMLSFHTPPIKSPCCSVQYSWEVSGLPAKSQMALWEEITFPPTPLPWYQMYTVDLIFKATFQTLSSGLWRKHTWEKIFCSQLSICCWVSCFCFFATLHISGHWSLSNAHVVFCFVFVELPLPAGFFHLLICLLKKEWSGTEEGS